MKQTFFLKEPNADKESLILFSCYFKSEAKKFVYSTGENIHPKHWDQSTRSPIKSGRNKCPGGNGIEVQLDRYKSVFRKTLSRFQQMGEDFTSKSLKMEFDKEFKKSNTKKKIFHEAFETFMDYKIKNQDWSKSTIKRYRNIFNILCEFEEVKKYRLTFGNINQAFYSEFTDFCLNDKQHINNTFSRNIGLFKAFMEWAYRSGYTYNLEFKDFQKKPRVVTRQIALNRNDLKDLMDAELPGRLERVRDVFIFACVTGMRFGELKLIRRESIHGNYLNLKEEKGAEKEIREIPLNRMAIYLLKKYDYKLPLIANQKQNEYIKEVFKLAGYDHQVEKVTTKGKEDIREYMPFYERISTHTARRTFITRMKEEGKSDKLIASITGHSDLKTLNQYYQVSAPEKTKAVDEVFDIDIPMKKVN
ncbi:MAG: integrase [Flavobacteriales bacterium]|nr:integrase [Flavobacteriales bacterium]